MKFISNKRYQRMEDQHHEQMRRLFEQKDEIERLSKMNSNLSITFRQGIDNMAKVLSSMLEDQSVELIKCIEEQI